MCRMRIGSGSEYPKMCYSDSQFCNNLGFKHGATSSVILQEKIITCSTLNIECFNMGCSALKGLIEFSRDSM